MTLLVRSMRHFRFQSVDPFQKVRILNFEKKTIETIDLVFALFKTKPTVQPITA